MSDDVQIVSVTKTERPKSSRRKRKRSAVYTDGIDVVAIENLPEVTLVELPTDQESYIHIDSDDDYVTVTSSSKQKKVDKVKKKSESTKENLEEGKTEKQKQKSDPEVPVYWSSCDKCGSYERRYHMIEVKRNTVEWLNVCDPLLRVGFYIQKATRIQNRMLWHRLQCERQLMCRTHTRVFDLNERLLYHTSRAETAAICAEGLDQRLSGSGSFGRGIYFSDNPIKCDMYWPCPQNTVDRKMFACRVLLGDIKVYPMGKADRALMREPAKPHSTSSNSNTGTFDSVLGNFKGINEFVVYNTYRVMPEYLIEYQGVTVPLLPQLHGGYYLTPPAVPLCHLCGELTHSDKRTCQYSKSL